MSACLYTSLVVQEGVQILPGVVRVRLWRALLPGDHLLCLGNGLAKLL